MDKYRKIDEMILARLSKIGPRSFSALLVGELATECKRVSAILSKEKRVGSATQYDRLLDRRLQALRKDGKIKYESKGWLLV